MPCFYNWKWKIYISLGILYRECKESIQTRCHDNPRCSKVETGASVSPPCTGRKGPLPLIFIIQAARVHRGYAFHHRLLWRQERDHNKLKDCFIHMAQTLLYDIFFHWVIIWATVHLNSHNSKTSSHWKQPFHTFHTFLISYYN